MALCVSPSAKDPKISQNIQSLCAKWVAMLEELPEWQQVLLGFVSELFHWGRANLK